MATTREGGAGGGVREKDGKRGNSSSNHQTKKPTTKPFTSSSFSSQRAVLNNLKPTLRSTLDPSPTSSSSSRIPRRSNTFNSSSASTAATTTKKLASVTRTQSADKLPSSTIPPTALRVPTTTTTRDVKTSHAAPSTEPKTSIKPGAKRSFSTLTASRSTKPAAMTPSIRRSLSNKACPSSSSSIGLRKKAVKQTSPKSAASDTSVELHEAAEKDPLDHMIGTGQDEPGMDGDEVQSLHDISDMPGNDDQLGDPVMVVQGAVIDSETTDCQAVNDQVEEEGQEIEVEEQDDALVVEDAPQESVESADNVEEEGAEEVLMEEDLTKVEEKHVVVEVEGSSGEENKEGDEMEGAAEVVKTERPAKQLTQSRSKKETQAYNDVIEETVSKLMENKRNRVRALAGAFETVISLDSK